MTMLKESMPAAPAEVIQPDQPDGVPAPLAVVQLQTAPRRGRLEPRPQSRVRVKRAIWAVVAAGLAATLAIGLRPKPVGVETAAVTVGTLVVTVDEDGRTRVKDRYVISAPLAGTVTRMTLEAGDSVAQGAVVARLVPSASPLLDPRSRAEAEARVAAARGALSQAGTAVERARAAYGFARREAERQRALLREGATAPQTAEQAELSERMRQEDVASAEFGRRVAASDLLLAQAALARIGAVSRDEFSIRAPVRGQVLRVLQESEGVVQPGSPLLEIGDPLALEVVVDVLTTDAVDIRPGAPVRIERWGGDSALTGHVHQVEPSAFTRLSALGVEEQRVNVVIDPDAPRERWGRLGDGYRVEASIVVWVGRDRLLAPGGAVFRQGEGWATYVVKDGRTRLRSIELGRRNASQIEVLKGLRAGERVVLYPTDKVRDGARAEVR
jgi:HlyD family secretion protein